MRAQEFVNEVTNPDIHDNRFKHEQEIGDFLYKAEADNTSGYGTQLIIKVYDGRKEIATTEFMMDEDHNSLVSANTWVLPKYQELGIATTMYAYAKMLGNDIVPSRIQTDQGNRMWRSWNQAKQSRHILPRGHKGFNEYNESSNVNEGLNYPIICVDVQPEYDNPLNQKIINFVCKQTGPVLFFVNAEDTGMTGDSMQSIQQYWDERAPGGTPEEEGEDEEGNYYYNEPVSAIDWRRFHLVDKGYGYFRAWMDHGIEESIIIAAIREMYAQKVSDSRDLEFPGFNQRTPTQSLIMGAIEEMDGDALGVQWTSVAQLKRFNGAYIVGGGRNECLREVELLMNAFNIKYKRIESLVY